MAKDILRNKKINFEYEILDTFKAGLVLEGWMVKSIRAGKISGSDSCYVRVFNGECFLIGLHLKSLIQTNTFKKIEEQPTLKLLLNKKEINKLIGVEKEKGYTVVLKNIFWEGHLVKANICLVKGKKNHDKRKDLKEKDQKRETERALKTY